MNSPAAPLASSVTWGFVLIGGGVKWQNTPREILVRDAGGHSSVNDPDGGVTQVANAIEAATGLRWSKSRAMRRLRASRL